MVPQLPAKDTHKMAQKRLYSVTGTFHGAQVIASSEGEARRLFHAHYNGESIIHIKLHSIIQTVRLLDDF